MTSLTGIDNMTSIWGDLKINHNDILSSISGLSNINANSISNLHISFNDSLSTCNVKSVCDYLASPNGTINIQHNASGCSSQAEVDSLCTIVSINNLDVMDDVTIFPNPAKKEVFISCKNREAIKEINIYNQFGQKIMHETRLTNMIDISRFQQGMYILEFISNEFIIRKKLIIE